MDKLLYVTVKSDVSIDHIVSYLLENGADRVVIKELKTKIKSETQAKPESKPEPKPEPKPEYVRPVYREPPPIVTPDKRGYQQEHLAKWIIDQHPKIIFPDEVKIWLVDNGYSPTSVSVMAYLTKYRIHSNGKGKGYSYKSADSH